MYILKVGSFSNEQDIPFDMSLLHVYVVKKSSIVCSSSKVTVIEIISCRARNYRTALSIDQLLETST